MVVEGRRSIFTLGIAVLLAFAPTWLHAQIDTGRVVGTVTDPSGAVIPKTQVVLINNATKVAQKAFSTSTGTYVFEAVTPGSYTLEAEFPGFQKFVVPSLDVHIQYAVTMDIHLVPGSVAQEVIVSAADPLLQTENAAIGQTISGEEVNDLPLNGRNWTSLSQLAAGVATVAVGAPGSTNFVVDGNPFLQNDFRLDGIDDNQEFYASTGGMVIPPPDAIEEFKLQNGDFSAEFGHSTGGIVNAVVRSGTNHLHGDLWEYLRNTILDANDYFANQAGQARPAYHQNQFGGTIGGPVYIPKLYNGKDKTFFFFDYQGTRASTPSSYTSGVPTALEQSSAFTNLQDIITGNSGTHSDALGRIFPLGTVLDPATTRTVAPGAIDPVSGFKNTGSSTIYVRDPFYTVGSIAGIQNFTTKTQYLNQIPSSRIDPNAVKLLSLYPLPTSPGLYNNYFRIASSTTTINQFDARLDEAFKSQDTLFGVLDWSKSVSFVPSALPGLANGQTYNSGTATSKVTGIVLGYTHIFTPTLTNEFHAGWGYNPYDQVQPGATTMGIPSQYGISGVPQTTDNGGLPQIYIAALSQLGITYYTPTLETISYLELSDNVTKIYHNHALKAGFTLDTIHGNMIEPPASRGGLSYYGQYTDIPNANTGLAGLADVLVMPGASTVPGGISNNGGVSEYYMSTSSPTHYLRYYFGAYLQDDWKVSPNLTLNLGLRWDHFTPYAETHGLQGNFIQAGGDGESGTYYIPTKGCQVPRSAAFDALLSSYDINIQCTGNLAVGNAQPYNFAPRLGFAERMTSRIVARGGYGIAYGALDNIGFAPTLGNNYPFSYEGVYSAPTSYTPLTLPSGATATMENSLASIDVQNATGVNGDGLSLIGRQYDFQTPYTQTLNLTLQYQFTQHDAFQAGYVGMLGRHLDNLGVHNATTAIMPPGTNPFDPSVEGHVPFPLLAANSPYETTNASSSYNALQVTYQHHAVSGSTILANYTYSKCMSDQYAFRQNINGYRAEWLPGFGIKGDYALCDADATHVVHISGTEVFPIGRGQRLLPHIGGIANGIIGGWTGNYILTYQSGNPFTIPCAVSTTANFGCDADVVPGEGLYAGSHNASQWLNPKAFATPPVATQIGQTDTSPLGGMAQQVRGPGFTNLDASLFKNFSLPESMRLQFRLEAFNVFNHPQFGQPGQLNYTAADFSEITYSRNNPRILQVALKLRY